MRIRALLSVMALATVSMAAHAITIADVRAQFPKEYGDKSDVYIVHDMAKLNGISPQLAAYRLGTSLEALEASATKTSAEHSLLAGGVGVAIGLLIFWIVQVKLNPNKTRAKKYLAWALLITLTPAVGRTVMAYLADDNAVRMLVEGGFAVIFWAVVAASVGWVLDRRSAKIAAPPTEQPTIRQASDPAPAPECATRLTETPVIDEDKIYSAIADELESGNIDKGLWTRLFAQHDGDENKTKAAYIKHRVSTLMANAAQA
jgi:hypothetical protein